MGVRPAGNPADFHAPANARLERFIPHAAVLDCAVCAVTHAGMGALTKTAGAKRVAEGFAAAGGPRAAADIFGTRLIESRPAADGVA